MYTELTVQYTRHGGAYDRGNADAYYGRVFDPHYYIGATYSTARVVALEGTPEYDAYKLGFEECSDFKDWGEIDE